MRRLLVLMAGIVVLLAACGQAEPDASDGTTEPTAAPTDTGAEPTTEPTEPTAEPSEPTSEPTMPSPTEDDGEPARVQAFFVRAHDSGIWVEPVSVELDEPTSALARAAMTALVAGPPDGVDPALGTQVPDGTELLDVGLTDGVLTVDLSEELRAGSTGSAGELAFAQQLAHTGAQFDTVETVRLRVDGDDITELWGHLDWSQPIEADPFALSPITFTSHDWGADVEVGEVTVGGLATVFEATLGLRLLAPDGEVVEETFTTASEGAPRRGTWEHTFELDEPGTWTVEAIEDDPSGGEGRPPFTVTLELVAG